MRNSASTPGTGNSVQCSKLFKISKRVAQFEVQLTPDYMWNWVAQELCITDCMDNLCIAENGQALTDNYILSYFILYK